MLKTILMKLWFLALLSITIGSGFLCKSTEKVDSNLLITNYNLANPSQKIKLPKNLTEVSGLSIYDEKLYLVQDEDGDLFKMKLSEPGQFEKSKFGPKGDYEGVEIVNNKVYVLRSTGDIFQCNVNNVKSKKTRKVETKFTRKSNVEGFGYDSSTQQFIVGTKEEKHSGNRCIYYLKLDRLEDKPECFYQIDENELALLLKEKIGTLKFGINEGIAKNGYSFNPSGIAKHPKSGDIYILSHPVQQLLILSSELKIKEICLLATPLFKQPEGIAFDLDGNLYISNEGRNGSANILVYEYN